MSDKNKPNIYFYKVMTVPSKLLAVCTTAREQFLKKQRLLLTVPDETSCTYIDQLLWRIPEESFLPHQTSSQENEHLICVTTHLRNLNKATVLFNLCPNPSPIATQFNLIFEILDGTDQEKHRLSLARMETYQTAGYEVKTIPFDRAFIS